MKLGIIADDFTGASDIALTLSVGGMKVVQYVGVPSFDADANVEGGVVALKIRTARVETAVSDALRACKWLTSQGCTQIVYKICSTFDSTPAGNIGPVAEALAESLGETVVVVCPAFPDAGRYVFQGHLFVQDALLNESGMQDHPLTPMTDPDLRRVLSRQTRKPVAHVQATTVMEGGPAIAAALAGIDNALAIVDAIRDVDLVEIGKAACTRRLLVGGSGIALGLPANFGCSPHPNVWRGVAGPGVVLSGSCSPTTRAQVEAYRSRAPSVELKSDGVVAGNYRPFELRNWVLTQSQAPMIYSSADPAMVEAAQEKYGRTEIAAAVEDLFAKLAVELAAAGVTRLVVAGGETSGAVVSGLGAKALQIGPRIAPGVPALKVMDQYLALALKSGNFGGREFFSEALEALGQAA